MSDDETQPASTTDELWIEDDEPPSPDDLPGEERTAEEPAPLGAAVPVAPGALGGFVTPTVVPAAAAAAPPDEDSPDPDVTGNAER